MGCVNNDNVHACTTRYNIGEVTIMTMQLEKELEHAKRQLNIIVCNWTRKLLNDTNIKVAQSGNGIDGIQTVGFTKCVDGRP